MYLYSPYKGVQPPSGVGGGASSNHHSFEPGLKLFWQRFPQVNTNSLIFKPLKWKRIKPPRGNTQQKNSDLLTYLFRNTGNRVEDLTTELVASGEVVSSNIIWTVNWTTSS